MPNQIDYVMMKQKPTVDENDSHFDNEHVQLNFVFVYLLAHRNYTI